MRGEKPPAYLRPTGAGRERARAALAKRRALEALVVSSVTGADVPAEFRGWRSEVITDALLACL